MRILLAVVRRELETKRFLFASAFIVGLLAPASALLPNAERWGRGTMALTVAGVLAALMTIAVAMILGATVLGRDLSERRMSFYLSKPLSPALLWGGKVAGSIVAIIAVLLLILAPALLLFGSSFSSSWPVGAAAAIAAVLAIAVTAFFVAHAASTMVRARSAWIVLDLLLLAAGCGAAWLIAQPLLLARAFDALTAAGVLLAALLILVLAVSGGWQVARGRTDIRRNHAALSTFLWSGVTVALLLTAAYVAWLTHPTPSELKTWYAAQGASGEWVIVAGEARGRFDFEPVFLMSTYGSERRLLPISRDFGLDPAVSGDGRWLGVAELTAFNDQTRQLVLYDLQRLQASPRMTRIEIRERARFALSDDAARVAIWEKGEVAVLDVATGKLLASARIPAAVASPRVAMLFRDTALWIYVTADGATSPIEVTVYELMVPTRALRRVSSLAVKGRGVKLSTNGDGSLFMLRALGGETTIHDDSGRERLRITPGAGERVIDAQFLEEDRVTVSVKRADGTVILVRSLRTARQSVTRFSGDRLLTIKGEAAPGLLLLESSSNAPVPVKNDSVISVLSLNRGGVLRQEFLRSVGMMSGGWLHVDPRTPARLRERVFRANDGSLVLWDPITGDKRVLIAAPKR